MKTNKYYFKHNERKAILNGRTAIWVAEKTELSYTFVIRILNGSEPARFTMAYTITKLLDPTKEVSDFFDTRP